MSGVHAIFRPSDVVCWCDFAQLASNRTDRILLYSKYHIINENIAQNAKKIFVIEFQLQC